MSIELQPYSDTASFWQALADEGLAQSATGLLPAPSVGSLPEEISKKQRTITLPAKWTEEENKRFLFCIVTQTSWNGLAACFPCRSQQACISHWHSLQQYYPDIKPLPLKSNARNTWTPEEDRLLTDRRQDGDKMPWEEIKELFPRHTLLSCKNRWRKISKGGLDIRARQPWTKEADRKLFLVIEQFGKHWKLVKPHMNGYSRQRCYYRYDVLLKNHL